MDFKDLTPGQRAKIDAAKTPEEILAIAQEEGYELSRDELDSIAGGQHWTVEYTKVTCITCGYSWKVEEPNHGSKTVKCPKCGASMEIIVI